MKAEMILEKFSIPSIKWKNLRKIEKYICKKLNENWREEIKRNPGQKNKEDIKVNVLRSIF